MTLRIKGLVRAFNDVRARLQAGIQPTEAGDLRRYVGNLVERVEELCSRHGTTPSSLPAPSRRAYRFLKALDTARLPSPDKNGPSPRPSRLRLPNVVKNTGLFSKKMWDELTMLLESADGIDRLNSDMQAFLSDVEAVCAQRDSTPSSLATPSRRAYGWVKFLVKDHNLRLHLEALDRGRSALAEMFPESDRVAMHMANMDSIWRRRTRGRVVTLKVNEGFLHADERVWKTFINGAVNGRDRKLRGVVDEYVDSEDFSSVLFEMEALARPVDKLTAGRVHDLNKSFDRVNAAYFAGSLPEPQLCWNNVITARKFGHYEFARDTVMLSISLDDPAVSEQLVDYVMYHELLHKKHGVKLINGRRMAHTSAFRKEEKRFQAYEETVAKLSALAQRHGAR